MFGPRELSDPIFLVVIALVLAVDIDQKILRRPDFLARRDDVEAARSQNLKQSILLHGDLAKLNEQSLQSRRGLLLGVTLSK